MYVCMYVCIILGVIAYNYIATAMRELTMVSARASYGFSRRF